MVSMQPFVAARSREPRSGDVRLSAAVMAHPSRAPLVDELLGWLDRPVEVVWDRRSDRWDTGRRAQLAYDPQATHHLVVQDDAIVPPDLCAGLERALLYTPPDAALCLYIGRVRPHAGRIARAVQRANGCSWITMRDLHWGVGIVLPTPIIEACIKTQDRAVSIAQYDRRISRWLVQQRIPVWYPWPSLVEHRDTMSLIGHGEGRHAHEFLGRETSVLDADWSGPVLCVPDPQAMAMTLPQQVSRRPVVERRRGRGATVTEPAGEPA